MFLEKEREDLKKRGGMFVYLFGGCINPRLTFQADKILLCKDASLSCTFKVHALIHISAFQSLFL